MEQIIAEAGLARSSAQLFAGLVNLGLLLGIAASVISFLPVDLPGIDRLEVRTIAGLSVVVLLVLSFWLAGWPGSALGITLLGMALVFTVLVGQSLGLVGLTLAFLTSVCALLLMVSDWPSLKDGEWVGHGYLAVYLGFLANLVVATLSVVLWLAYGVSM